MQLRISADGVDGLAALAAEARITRRPLRKALRDAANIVKAEAKARAAAISRRLARKVRVRVDRRPVPRYAVISNSYPGAFAIERGRRAGAKAPPVTALRGGWPAAQAVAKSGLPARPFMAPAAKASAGAVDRRLSAAGREMETIWAAAKARAAARAAGR